MDNSAKQFAKVASSSFSRKRLLLCGFFLALWISPLTIKALEPIGDEQIIQADGKVFGVRTPLNWLIKEREYEGIDGEKVNRLYVYDKAEDLSSVHTRYVQIYSGNVIQYLIHIPKVVVEKGGLTFDDVINYYIHRARLSLLKYTVVSAEKKKLGKYDLYEIKEKYIRDKKWHASLTVFLFYGPNQAIYVTGDYLLANESKFKDLITNSVESLRLAN
jgi:hypothetical protein